MTVANTRGLHMHMLLLGTLKRWVVLISLAHGRDRREQEVVCQIQVLQLLLQAGVF
jgi:hypothetical protein